VHSFQLPNAILSTIKNATNIKHFTRETEIEKFIRDKEALEKSAKFSIPGGVVYTLHPDRGGIIVRGKIPGAFERFMSELNCIKFFGTERPAIADGSTLGAVCSHLTLKPLVEVYPTHQEQLLSWYGGSNGYLCITLKENVDDQRQVFNYLRLQRPDKQQPESLTVHFAKDMFALSMDNWNHWERIMDHVYDTLQKCGAQGLCS
jgi:hypothetical protein